MKATLSILFAALSLSAVSAFAADPAPADAAAATPLILKQDCDKTSRPAFCKAIQAAEKKCADKKNQDERRACVKAEMSK